MKPSPATMATNSERQIGEKLTDSLLMDMTPEYLPDVSALQVPPAAYQGKYNNNYYSKAVF